jgi:hypothetical protein
VAEITLSQLRKHKGYKDPALIEGVKGIMEKISFQRTPKTILKYYLEFYLSSKNRYILNPPSRPGDVGLDDN